MDNHIEKAKECIREALNTSNLISGTGPKSKITNDLDSALSYLKAIGQDDCNNAEVLESAGGASVGMSSSELASMEYPKTKHPSELPGHVDYLGSVKKFHKAFELPIGQKPQNIVRKAFARRARLINEELSEYCKAVGSDDIVEIADALSDLLYVTFGAAIEHGLPMDEIFAQTQKSNMTKVGGHKDSSGKFIKPDTYTPVDLSWLLKS